MLFSFLPLVVNAMDKKISQDPKFNKNSAGLTNQWVNEAKENHKDNSIVREGITPYLRVEMLLIYLIESTQSALKKNLEQAAKRAIDLKEDPTTARKTFLAFVENSVPGKNSIKQQFIRKYIAFDILLIPDLSTIELRNIPLDEFKEYFALKRAEQKWQEIVKQVNATDSCCVIL